MLWIEKMCNPSNVRWITLGWMMGGAFPSIFAHAIYDIWFLQIEDPVPFGFFSLIFGAIGGTAMLWRINREKA
jgi:hypothetical protein